MTWFLSLQMLWTPIISPPGQGYSGMYQKWMITCKVAVRASQQTPRMSCWASARIEVCSNSAFSLESFLRKHCMTIFPINTSCSGYLEIKQISLSFIVSARSLDVHFFPGTSNFHPQHKLQLHKTEVSKTKMPISPMAGGIGHWRWSSGYYTSHLTSMLLLPHFCKKWVDEIAKAFWAEVAEITG